MRMIFDVNIWISCMIKVSFQNRVMSALGDNPLLVSEALFAELRDKVEEDKFRKYFSLQYAIEKIEAIKNTSTMIEVTSVVTACIDEKDNYLLALALDGEADILLSSDGHLLNLHTFGKTKILLLSDFEKTYL